MVCLPLITEQNSHEICLTQECLQIVRRLLWKRTTTHSLCNNNPMFDGNLWPNSFEQPSNSRSRSIDFGDAIDASRKPRHYMGAHLVIVNFLFRGGTTFSYEYQMLAEVECQRSRSWELRNRLSKPLFPKKCRWMIPILVKRVVEKSFESSQ